MQYIRRVQPKRFKVSQFIYFCKTLYMFQTCFPSIIRSSKLHIQRQVAVRPIPLPAGSPVRLAAGSTIGLTLYMQFWATDDGRKTRLKHVQRVTEINNLWDVASCWLHSANLPPMSRSSKCFLSFKFSPTKSCMNLSSPTYVLHVPPNLINLALITGIKSGKEQKSWISLFFNRNNFQLHKYS